MRTRRMGEAKKSNMIKKATQAEPAERACELISASVLSPSTVYQNISQVNKSFVSESVFLVASLTMHRLNKEHKKRRNKKRTNFAASRMINE